MLQDFGKVVHLGLLLEADESSNRPGRTAMMKLGTVRSN